MLEIYIGKPRGIEIEVGVKTVNIGAPTYSGPYMVTPGRELQTLNTANKRLNDNLVIQPIPKNYGLITYNGFEITVS